jgi:hypothetical protein
LGGNGLNEFVGGNFGIYLVDQLFTLGSVACDGAGDIAFNSRSRSSHEHRIAQQI